MEGGRHLTHDCTFAYAPYWAGKRLGVGWGWQLQSYNLEPWADRPARPQPPDNPPAKHRFCI
eukprot:1729366-Pleurochrysis_carterae.AAC.1